MARAGPHDRGCTAVRIAGLLLAAGAGRRMGHPKALLRDRDGVPFLQRGVALLLAGGCERVTVVLGASADEAALLLSGEAGDSRGADPGAGWAAVAGVQSAGVGVAGVEVAGVGVAGAAVAQVEVVVAEDWDEGMGASLRAGLGSLADSDAEAALVSLVDLPDLSPAVLRRVVAAGEPAGPGALVRATYDGRPGHPVLIGREHWAGVAATSRGDQGARDYLVTHGAAGCECGDLATGRDVDRPEDLADDGP